MNNNLAMVYLTSSAEKVGRSRTAGQFGTRAGRSVAPYVLDTIAHLCSTWGDIVKLQTASELMRSPGLRMTELFITD